MYTNPAELVDMCTPSACHHKHHRFSQRLAISLNQVSRKAEKKESTFNQIVC